MVELLVDGVRVSPSSSLPTSLFYLLRLCTESVTATRVCVCGRVCHSIITYPNYTYPNHNSKRSYNTTLTPPVPHRVLECTSTEVLRLASRCARGSTRLRICRPKSLRSTYRHNGSSFIWMASYCRMTAVCWHSTTCWQSVQCSWFVCTSRTTGSVESDRRVECIVSRGDIWRSCCESRCLL